MTVPWMEELQARPVIRPRRWAELSGMPPSTVYDAIKNGSIPGVHVGTAIYIPTVPLLEMLGVSPQNDESAPKDAPVLMSTPAAIARKESDHEA